MVVSRFPAGGASVALDREQNVCETGRGLLAVPIALQFADQLHPPDRFAARLDETLYAEFMRLGRGTADAIHQG